MISFIRKIKIKTQLPHSINKKNQLLPHVGEREIFVKVGKRDHDSNHSSLTIKWALVIIYVIIGGLNLRCTDLCHIGS